MRVGTGAVASRRAAALAAVGVLALASACGTERGVASGGSGSGGTPAGNAAGLAISSADLLDEFSCPPVPSRGEPFTPVTGPDALADGAVAVRMCDPGGLFGTPPSDALTTGAQKVVDSVNALAVAARCDVVPMDLGPTWDLIFLYGDGHTQTVRGSTHGCGGVEVGSIVRGGREDAGRPLRLFQRLLWGQRGSTGTADLRVAPPGCDDGDPEEGAGLTVMPLQEPLTLRHAVLCWRFETVSEQPGQQAAIGEAELAALLEDLNHKRSAREITEQECVGPDVIHYRIIGVNAWGDRLSLDGYCGVFDLSGTNSDIWRPDSKSQAILDRLVAGRPRDIAAPGPRTPPDQVVAIWADLVNGGQQARAADLWADSPDVPSGARVQLKTEEVRAVRPAPGTPGAAYRALVEVGALYRLVPADGSWVDYHQVRFTLGRERAGTGWRIVKMTDDGAVATGR